MVNVVSVDQMLHTLISLGNHSSSCWLRFKRLNLHSLLSVYPWMF